MSQVCENRRKQQNVLPLKADHGNHTQKNIILKAGCADRGLQCSSLDLQHTEFHAANATPHISNNKMSLSLQNPDFPRKFHFLAQRCECVP